MKKLLVHSFEFLVKILAAFLLFLLLPTTNYPLLTTYAQAATLSLFPTSGTFNRGCPFSADVNLDTGGAETDGTDAVVLYDNSRLTATSINAGNFYPDLPGNSIDDTIGKVTISGVASQSQTVKGVGKLATINFMVKESAASGSTQVKFDFDPNNKAETRDSNVAQHDTAVDILNSVTNANYTIGAGPCTATSSGALSGGGRGAVGTSSGQVKQPVGGKLPPAGVEQFSATVAIIGVTLTILGVLGMALL